MRDLVVHAGVRTGIISDFGYLYGKRKAVTVRKQSKMQGFGSP